MTKDALTLDGGDTQYIMECEGLKKYFNTEQGFLSGLFGKDEQVRAVDGIDLQIKKGEIVGLAGESGIDGSSPLQPVFTGDNCSRSFIQL